MKIPEKSWATFRMAEERLERRSGIAARLWNLTSAPVPVIRRGSIERPKPIYADEGNGR
jgi:hypothetical protein